VSIARATHVSDDELGKLLVLYSVKGAHSSLVVKALRYKPAGRGFDSRWCHWNVSVT
jgi:hypothetical protein